MLQYEDGMEDLMVDNTVQPDSYGQQSDSLPYISDSFSHNLQPQNHLFYDNSKVNTDFVTYPFDANSSDGSHPAELPTDNQPATFNLDHLTGSKGLTVPQYLPYDVSDEGNKNFEVIPVTATQGDVYPDGVDNAPKMQTLAIANREDISKESKGYNSDSSSDVYMNSDYTDTIDSTGSSACLLKDDKGNGDNIQQSGHHLPQILQSDKDKAPVAYANRVFSENGSKECIPQSTEDQKVGDVHEVDDDTNVVKENNWLTGVQDADSKILEDEASDDDGGDTAPLQEETALESLVHQLAEHHPGEMTDITVEMLDAPGNERKSESLQMIDKLKVPLQNSLLHSTESLHAYKLKKQGYSSSTNNVHMRAVNNWRSNTMDNINHLASSSVANLGHVCQKALGYLRSDMEFGSMMSVGDSAKQPSMLAVGEGQPPSDEEVLSDACSHKGQPSVASGRHMRNLLAMAFLITIFFVANFATRNLQSSLNQDGAVGVICLAVMFVFYILGSLLSPVLVQGLGVKRCIVGGLVFQFIYVAANLHPEMWLMVPASMGGGASLTLIWNAMSTYVVMLARGESDFKQKSYERVADRYFGVFCLIYQSNLVIGNLIAGLVLSYGASNTDSATDLLLNSTLLNSTATNMSAYDIDLTSRNASLMHDIATGFLLNVTNSSVAAGDFSASEESHYSICGTDFCHHYEIKTGAASVSKFTIFLLFGIFMLLIVICILMGLFLLEPLSPHLFPSRASAWLRVKNQCLSLARFSRNKKFVLLLPLLLYSVMQYSFVSSEITVAFVTCPIGVWMVGYAMMSYGAFCSIGSYVCQALSPKTGRFFFIAAATLINIALLIFMRMWKPDPDSTPIIIVLCILFGFADGIWNVCANGICGSVFPDHYEEAFTGLRMAQGVGGTFNMAYSPLFCLTVKIYVMMGIVSVVFLGYVGAEVIIRRENREKKNAVLYEKEVV